MHDAETYDPGDDELVPLTRGQLRQLMADIVADIKPQLERAMVEQFARIVKGAVAEALARQRNSTLGN